jgi:D-glycero-D-manno-heptose 1,7-bisphosphate phosphatase
MARANGAERTAVFLDRDGVLNEPVVRNGRPFPPSTLEDFNLLPGVPDACDTLQRAGFLLIVVTNQPDIARATQERSVVEEMHNRLLRNLPIEAVYMCPHDDDDGCQCRKPEPGLLLQAADELRVNLRSSIMVGDRWRDVEAGRRAGCLTAFVDRGYSEAMPADANVVVRDLGAAADWIVAVRDRLDSRARECAAPANTPLAPE